MALAGRRERSNPSQASVSTCTAPFKGEVEIPTLLVAWGPSTSVAVSPRRRSWSAQDQGSARASAVMVRPAGAVPSRRPEMIRGETKASGISSRTCRSTFRSRPASMAKLPRRPWASSSAQLRALAIAISRASRRDGIIGVL